MYRVIYMQSFSVQELEAWLNERYREDGLELVTVVADHYFVFKGVPQVFKGPPEIVMGINEEEELRERMRTMVMDEI